MQQRPAAYLLMISLALVSVLMHGIGVYSDYTVIRDSDHQARFDIVRHPGQIWSWDDSPPLYLSERAMAASKGLL
jgi:hypothetical protein